MTRLLALLALIACVVLAFGLGPVKARSTIRVAASIAASAHAADAAPLPTPTMTAEPTTPTTVQLEKSDSYADGIGMTTTMSVKPYPSSGNFRQVAPFFCGNFAAQNGILTPTKSEYQCIRHLRNGLWSENSAIARADTNILSVKYGVDSFQIINPGDTDAAITAALKLYARSDGVGMSNEIDANNYGESIGMPTKAGDTSIILSNCCSQPPFPGSSVEIEPGTPSSEVVVIKTTAGYTGGVSSGQGTIMNVIGKCSGGGMCHDHAGGLHTTLAAPITGYRTAAPYTPYPTTTSPTPVMQTLPTFPAAPMPNSLATAIAVSNVTGFAAGQYVTLDCGSVNSGRNTISETVHITSISGNMLNLDSRPSYSHNMGGDVREGCILVVPTNGFWGALTYGPNQLTQLRADLGNSATILSTAFASPPNANAFSPFYGGTAFTGPQQSALNVAQVHYCSGLNCGGSWGDGKTGEHAPVKACSSYECPPDSWEAAVSSVQAVVGTSTPWWCSECSWAIIPTGATQDANSLGNQFPEDEAVAFAGSVFYLLHHGATRFYWSAIADGDTFCDNGLLYMPAICTGNGFNWDKQVGTPTPKALYYTLTDLYGLFDDPQCRLPGCTFTPQSITWNWSSLPKPNHIDSGNFVGVDPSQFRSVQTEDSYGDFKMEFHYEAMHYLPGRTACTTYMTMGCYQFCASTLPGYTEQVSKLNLGPYVGGPNCSSQIALTIVAAAKKSCTLWDADMNSTHSNTFGHLEPLSTVTFDATDTIRLFVRPEPQVLVCAKALTPPTLSGTNVSSPTPVAEATSPDPTPAPAPAATTYPPKFQ